MGGAHYGAGERISIRPITCKSAPLAMKSCWRALRNGIRTNDGEFLRVKNVRVLPQGERHSWLEIVLDEGKNRHIRRDARRIEDPEFSGRACGHR